jgi:hypothetical protein
MIKMILICFFLFLSATLQAMNAGAAEMYRNLIVNYNDLPTVENATKLFEGLEICGRYVNKDNQLNVAVYEELKNSAVTIPQHVDILTGQVESARAKLPEGTKWHSGEHNSFQSLRVMIVRDTLCHIPSPEVVQLLGSYLYDERDTPPPIRPGQDWIDSNSNAYMACRALQKIGLKNSPLPPRASENPDNLATWKLWWGPIKAGNRTFSFVGQDVEYRFRKDGTYEALSRDGAQQRITKDVGGEIDSTPTKIGKPAQRWLILLGGCAALFAWLRWQAKRRKS